MVPSTKPYQGRQAQSNTQPPHHQQSGATAKPQAAKQAAFVKRACLRGEDLARLIRGEAVRANGIDFIYDGTSEGEVAAAVNDLLSASQQP